MSAEVVVVARIPAKPGQGQALADAFAVAAAKVHAEDAGCLLYATHLGDGDDMWIIEKWASVADLDAHGTSDAMKAVGGAIGAFVGGAPEVHRLTAVPTPGSDKGLL
jgi:quinol monooxygenase YgiN